jgi:putative phosphoribosyl transferase
MSGTTYHGITERAVHIPSSRVTLEGDLSIPEAAGGVVLFAHGSGSGRHSSRNRFVAGELNHAGIATLLFDLLTVQEEAAERYTAHLRFDIDLLTQRLVTATDWLVAGPDTKNLPIGYFGASTGAAAALSAAAERPELIAAVVSRGGRPDLSLRGALAAVRAPTLLIVGGDDEPVIGMNRSALNRLTVQDRELVIIPGATHLFEEPGALEEVARLAGEWFARHLVPPERSTAV